MTDQRARFRAQFPEIADVVDHFRAMGADPKVRHITDHDGRTLAGKAPVDPPGLVPVRAEAIEALHRHYEINKVDPRPVRGTLARKGWDK